MSRTPLEGGADVALRVTDDAPTDARTRPVLYTAADILSQHQSTRASERVAIVDGACRLTYAELLDRARGYAGMLQEAGVRTGDRVALFLPRSADAVIALFATWFAGGVGVPIFERLRARQVRHIVEHCEARCLVTDEKQLLYVPDLPLDGTRVVTLDHARPGAAPGAPERVIGGDLALLVYTSGSTGAPKGIMLSHANLLAGARIVSDYLNLTTRDILISLLPFSFDYGLNQLLTALLVGGTLVIQRSLFPADICRTLENERITGMAGVPTLWLQLTGRHSPWTRRSFPHLRYVTNSGGRLPEHVTRLIRQSHPHVKIYLMYGLTEAFRSTYLPPDEVDVRPTSVGKAIPDVDILVVNDEGRPCDVGEVGELVHRGPTVALGYWRDPSATARVFRPHPFRRSDDGYRETVVFSGDLVKTDAQGYLYFVGRKDELIKSSGFRVSPEEVERCILGSELVRNVVVFGVPVTEGDDAIVAAVVPGDPATFREELLRDFCRREMPEYMQPRVVWCLENFPLTSSGKPDRCTIRQMYA